MADPGWIDVPLIGEPYETVEEMQLDQWAATVVDAIPIMVEDKLQLIKRFGLTPWITLGTNASVDGLYWFDRQQVALVMSQGRVWKISDSAGTITELLGSTALRTSSPATFADDGTKAIMANGGQMVYTDLSTLSTVADVDAPTAVTHVDFLDGYIMANKVGTASVYFSALDDMTNWDALQFFSSDSNPDDLSAMKVGFREVCALGRKSVEFWVNDGTTPFSRIDGSAQPYGTEAPMSLVQVGGTWMWLDHTRRFATMNGRQVVNVSSPYDRVIQEMSSVNDAVGYAVSVSGHPLYVLNFPTAKQTLCFNYITNHWFKWGYWDLTTAAYQRFRGLSYCYARAWNTHLIGDYANGIIYKADRSIFTDNGNPIRTLLRTGHVSHGTTMTKRSENFRLKCKRGAGNGAVSNPQIVMRTRKDNKPQWTNERWKSLGRVGEHEMFIDWRRNGIYKTAQREIVHSDNSDFIITGAQELVTPLGR